MSNIIIYEATPVLARKLMASTFDSDLEFEDLKSLESIISVGFEPIDWCDKNDQCIRIKKRKEPIFKPSKYLKNG